MKKTFFLLYLFFLAEFGKAQTSLTPDIISAGGGISKYNNIELEWTLGETAIGYAAGYNRYYTVGFHQPVLVSAKMTVPEITSNRVHVFPNPADNTVKVQLGLDKEGNLKLVLTDVLGKTVASKSVNGKTSITEMQVHHLVAGVYLLRITDVKGDTIGSFKLIKVN